MPLSGQRPQPASALNGEKSTSSGDYLEVRLVLTLKYIRTETRPDFHAEPWTYSQSPMSY